VDTECVAILNSLGFISLDIDVAALARSYLGHAKWDRYATIKDAPGTFNCSVFTKYIYGQVGIWIPRYGVQQREFGTPVSVKEACAGDLVFVEGRHSHYYADPGDGVGHVGLVSDSKTIISAGGPNRHVNEMPIDDFIEISGAFRGVRRLVPEGEPLHAFLIPEDKMVEYSDDLRWLVMANVHKK
jgi:cell wall-associated NlpC family hydrolase